MSKVSVIVPVYNTGLYVERAVISLMEQTLQDAQFIIIDDGSKDNSLNIIKQVIARYPARAEQVTLISRENRGVAATRNQGMELATGDYITYLDSDDWAEINWLESMHAHALKNGADIVVCDYFGEYKKKRVYTRQSIPNDIDQCVKNLLLDRISNSNWNKLIARHIFIDNKIVFNRNFSLGEDFLVSLQVFINAKKICHIEKALYHYNIVNMSSLTKVASDKALDGLLKVVEEAYAVISNKGKEKFFEYELKRFKNKIRTIFILQSVGNNNRKEKALSLFNEANSLIKIGTAPKALLILYILSRFKLSVLYPVFDWLLIFNEKLIARN